MAARVVIKRDSEGLLLLDRDAICSLFERSDIANMEVGVVGVVGSSKSGKSFLLNYIMRYFRNEGQGVLNWMKDKDAKKPLEGFPWNCPNETSEQICIWSEAFIVEKENGKQMAVFLIEFGGAQDILPHFQELALRTCSLVIFNEVGKILTSTLAILFSSHYEFLKSKELSFPRITFLVRDVQTEFKKIGEKQVTAYMLREYQNLNPAASEDDIPAALKKLTFGFLPAAPEFTASSFLGEFSALGKPFYKPLGEFISEIMDSDFIGFNPTSKNTIDGETFASLFGNQELLANFRVLKSLSQSDVVVLDIPEPMEIEECSTDSKIVGQVPEHDNSYDYPAVPDDVSEAQDLNPICTHTLVSPLSKSKVTEEELSIQMHNSKTSFHSPTKEKSLESKLSPLAKEFRPSSAFVNPVQKFYAPEALKANSDRSAGLQKNTNQSAYFPYSNQSLLLSTPIATTSNDSVEKSERLVPAASRSTDDARIGVENRVKPSLMLPGYDEPSALLESAILTLNMSVDQQLQVNANEFAASASKEESASPVVDTDVKAKIVTIPNTHVPCVEAVDLENSTGTSAVVEAIDKLEKEVTEDRDVELLMKRHVATFKERFQETLNNELNIVKLKKKHSELELMCLASFEVLCSVKDKAFKSDIGMAVEQLAFDLDEHWDVLEKQHNQQTVRIVSDGSKYESVYTESVKSALKLYFDSTHPQHINDIMRQAKSKADTVTGQQNYGKFQPIFQKNIILSIEKVNKKAKLLIDTLFPYFKCNLEKKISMFICLSEKEFKKCESEYKTQALKAFREVDDPEFYSLLQSQLSNISRVLENRNTSIRQCEERVARYTIDYVKNCYNAEMHQFCNKRVHTSRAMREFHAELSNAAIKAFNEACNFNSDSGIDVGKYTLSLRKDLDSMLQGYVDTNSVQVMKASQMVSKANSKAKAEYNKQMTIKLGDQSVTDHQLNQYHDELLNTGLNVFRLDIKQIVENCEVEIRYLRENINNTCLPEIRQENAERREREVKKEQEEKAAKEQACREEESRIEAENKKRRQSEALNKQSKKKSQNKSQTARNLNESSDRSSAQTESAGPSYAQAVAGTGASAKIERNTDVAPQAIAIELGIKFIRAGYMHPKDGPKVIPLEGQEALLRSIIGVDEKNNIVFGQEAKGCDQKIPLANITDMKVSPKYTLIIQGKVLELRIEELTALILIHVKKKCEKFIGSSVSKAIITIPSWYTQELRQATKYAASLAGFVENRLISEASAVAISWLSQNQNIKPCGKGKSSIKLLVAIASDLSFDVAGFEIEGSTCISKKSNIGRRNFSMGRLQYFKNKLIPWSDSSEENSIITEALGFSKTGKSDFYVFMPTAGYIGNLNSSCLKKHCTVSQLDASNEMIIQGSTLYSGMDTQFKLKDVTTYAMICEDRTQKQKEICKLGDLLTLGSRKFNAITKIPGPIKPTMPIKLKILERVFNVNNDIGMLTIQPPNTSDDGKELKLQFSVSNEGILSAEAKYGNKIAEVELTTGNLSDLTASKETISKIFESEDKLKALEARQEAFQNLKSIEQELRESIHVNNKILTLLKPAIIKEIDKIVQSITDSSDLTEVEEGVKKLTKYSEKYIIK